MSDFKKLYKMPPSTFGNARKIKVNLAQQQRERRRKRRTLDFEETRKEASPCSAVSQNDKPSVKLDKKTNSRRKKEAQESQKKPPFVVGIVHHHFYSPVASTKVVPTKKKTAVQAQNSENSKVVKKRITKATEKRLLAKAANAETKRKELVTSTREKSGGEILNKVKTSIRRESFASPNHKFNPPAGLLKISLFRGDNHVSENNTFARDQLTDIQELFPCNSDSIEAITLKVSLDEQETSDSLLRKQTNSMVKSMLNDSDVKPSQFSLHPAKEKENCSKDTISLPNYLNNVEDNIKRNKIQDNSDLCQASGSSDQINNLITKMENSNVSAEKKRTIEYFEGALNKEKSRLQKLCAEWTKIQSQDGITEDIRYQINQAVGQTTMLIKEKFKRFHSLIMDCERNDGDVLVTCMDLHGFWDMMYIEVKDCDWRFAKLEKLRARCWQEEQSSFVKFKEKIVIKKKAIPARKSSLGTLNLSDKKKKITKIQDNEKNSQEIIDVNNNKCITPSITDKRNVFRKTSDAACNKKFLKISSNDMMYTSTPLSTKAASNISNQLCTPLIAMKVSQFYNKSMMLNTPERTPRKSSIEKVGRSRNKSLEMNLARMTLNDHLTMTKSSDEKLEVGQDSLKKINKYDELDVNEDIHIEGKSDFGIDGSVQTVIEKTINAKSDTLKLSSHSTDSIKTPTESKRSVKRSSSSKNLEITLFGTSSSHLIVKSPGISTTINISPTSCNALLIHDSRNISSKTTSTNRESTKQFETEL